MNYYDKLTEEEKMVVVSRFGRGDTLTLLVYDKNRLHEHNNVRAEAFLSNLIETLCDRNVLSEDDYNKILINTSIQLDGHPSKQEIETIKKRIKFEQENL